MNGIHETLRQGWHLFPSSDGSWMLLAPDERFIRLRIDPDQAERLARHLGGEPLPDGGDDLQPLLETFKRQDLLAPRDRPRPDLSRRRVLVRGNGPVAVEVTRLLRETGVGRLIVDPPDLSDLSELPDLIIACAGWLPDADWLRLDAWCRERDVAWTGCHAEGLHFYAGPMAIPGRTAGYADVRARRLAAARFPAELEALWRHLDHGQNLPPIPWPGAAGVAALAALVVSDPLAWLAGGPLPHEGEQICFDPADFSWRGHPVLPVPRNLMLEAVA